MGRIVLIILLASFIGCKTTVTKEDQAKYLQERSDRVK